MYWADSHSNIDTLLAKEDVSLQAILDEDDVLQECIACNQPLIDFLIDDNRMEEMLALMVHENAAETNDFERYKYASIISELFTFKKNVFAEKIANTEKYLSKVWSFVSLATPTETNEETTESTKPEEETESTELVEETTESTKPEEEREASKQEEAKPRELNPMLASFYSKVVIYLIQNHFSKVIRFISNQAPPNDLVSVFLRHISTSAMMDLFFKTWEFVNVKQNKNDVPSILKQEEEDEDEDAAFAETALLLDKMIADGKLLDKLIELFRDTQAELQQKNAANLISDLVRSGRESLLNNPQAQIDNILKLCESTEFTRSILANMFEARTRCSVTNALRLIQDLLVYRVQVEHMSLRHKEHLSSLSGVASGSKNDIDAQGQDVEDVQASEGMPNFLKMPAQSTETFITPQLNSPDGLYGEHLQRCIRNVCTALNERLEDFIDLLTNPIGPINPIATTAGVLNTPLGLIRLEVIHLFVAMFATADSSILEKCAQLNVLKILTDLFFEYKLNNQLHKYYEQITIYVISNYSSFRDIYHRQAIIKPEPFEHKDESNPQPANEDVNNEKMLNFVKLYNVSKTLMVQLVDDCRLVENILDSYADEIVPTRSEESAAGSLNQTWNKDEPEKMEETVEKKSNKVRLDRPAYMGHLKLIANKLKTIENDQMLDECEAFNNEVRARWYEFSLGKLAQLNQLWDSKLVEETKMTEEQEQDIFATYLAETISGSHAGSSMPSVELLGADFESNSLKEARDQSKLMEAIDSDFNQYWSQEQNDKLNSLEKFFGERCSSSLYEIDEDVELGTTFLDEDASKLNNNQNGTRKQIVHKIIQQNFSDPFASSDATFEDNFANFSDINWDDAKVSSDVKDEDIWMEDTKSSLREVTEEDFRKFEASIRPISMFSGPLDEGDFAHISPANVSSPNHEDSPEASVPKEEQKDEIVDNFTGID